MICQSARNQVGIDKKVFEFVHTSFVSFQAYPNCWFSISGVRGEGVQVSYWHKRPKNPCPDIHSCSYSIFLETTFCWSQLSLLCLEYLRGRHFCASPSLFTSWSTSNLVRKWMTMQRSNVKGQGQIIFSKVQSLLEEKKRIHKKIYEVCSIDYKRCSQNFLVPQRSLSIWLFMCVNISMHPF